MTDDGAEKQPVPEAQASASDGLPTPAPVATEPLAESPSAPVAEDGPVPAPAEPTPAPAGPVPVEPAPAATPDPVVAPTHVAEPPVEIVVPASAPPEPPVPPEPAPVVAAAPPAPVAIRSRGMPPMLEFAAWRLLELLATVVVAGVLVTLLLRSETPADPALLVERLAITVPLVILALLVAAAVGLPIGYAAARIGSWLDVALRSLATLGASLAPIWLAMLLVLLFAATLQWLQPGGFVPWQQNPVGALASLVLPALALGLPLGAETALRMREALAAALADPALRLADDMGLSRSEAIRAHAVRPALADLAARMAIPLALLVPASLVIENVFYLPGLGRLIFSALGAGDMATLQLGLIALVAFVALCRFLGQVLQALADPRLPRRA